MKISKAMLWLYRRLDGARLLLAVSLLATLSPAQAASRCVEKNYLLLPDTLSCTYRSMRIASSAISDREVIWELPLGTPPAGGWPVALVYQGSLFPVEFSRNSSAPFGGFYELKTVKALLDAGYAVIAPRASAELAWLTNSAGPLTVYGITTDFTFLTNVFAAIDQGVFGPLNGNRKYATGISSGGYNSSRMAASFPGQFRALVVHSGSWATCLGPVCVVPGDLPDDHPPTKFIHGFLDTIVPWWSMDLYYDQLLYEGVQTERLTISTGGHEWFAQSPAAVVNWFNRHP